MYISKNEYYYILARIKDIRLENKDIKLDKYLRNLYLYMLDLIK